MPDSNPIVFQEAPAIGPIYRKLLLGRRPKLKPGESIPPISAEWKGAKTSPENLADYHALTGMPDGQALPLLYPHVLTAGLHLAIMADARFPLGILGAVHVRQHARQHRAIAPDEALDARVWVGRQRASKAGIEFEFNTELRAGEATVYEGVSGYMVRGKYGPEQEDLPLAAIPRMEGEGEEQGRWRVPPGMGRRYAKVARDYNPIHISNIMAKLFGFKKAIIHGMWAAATSLRELPTPDAPNLRCDLAFKGPIPMGSQVILKAQPQGEGHLFELYCAKNPRPCIVGRLTPSSEGERLISEGTE